VNIALRINRDNMDAYSDPGDLRPDWTLIHLGNGDVPDETVAATGAQVLVVDAVTPVTASLLEAMPRLRLIHSQGVAFDRIDCTAARERGIYVCNNPGVNAAAVAEHTVMLMLAGLRQLIPARRAVLAGEQMAYKNRCFSNALPELLGKAVGLIGFGAIGREVAARLVPFGCSVYFYTPSGKGDVPGAKALDLETLLRTCDIVSLHAPVTDVTRGMIGRDALARMKPGAILINTGRGETVVLDAVYEALKSRRLDGAGLDVLEVEPPPLEHLLINTARGALIDPAAVKEALERGSLGLYATDTLDPEPVTADNLLLSLAPAHRDRLLCTPHVAGLTQGSFRRTYRNIWRNVALVQDGRPPDFVVNGL
jgi:phosphoglycerate dehydrogenase-like enzyme